MLGFAICITSMSYLVFYKLLCITDVKRTVPGLFLRLKPRFCLKTKQDKDLDSLTRHHIWTKWSQTGCFMRQTDSQLNGISGNVV